MGAFSSELGEFGYPTGGYIRYIIYIGISIAEYILIMLLIRPKPIQGSKKVDRFVLIFFSCALIFYAIPIIIHGPAFLLKLNRYEFMDLPMVGFFNIKLFLGVMMLFLGIAARPGGDYRKYSFLLFFLTVAVMMMYGEKFSGPLISIIYFFGGLWIGTGDQKIRLEKILGILILALAFMASVYFLWGTSEGHSPYVIAEAFADRLARQGQAWWKLDELAMHQGGAHGFSVFQNLNYFNHSQDTPLGNHYIMSLIMPEKQYSAHEGSISAVYPAILYLNNNFGELLVYALIFNFIYWLVQIFYFHFLYRKQVIYLMPVFCLWYTVHLKIFESGNIYLLGHYKYLLGLMAAISIMLIIKSGAFRKNRLPTETEPVKIT